MAVTVATEQEVRLDFFKFIFGDSQGFVCIATEAPIDNQFRQKFFAWPQHAEDMLTYIDRNKATKNIWFCVNLLSSRERTKSTCLPLNLLWSDLDECKPEDVSPSPQVVIESSPGRFQAIWRLDTEIPPNVAEDYSRRIAYSYSDNGADKSGWDLTQLLRVPHTLNFKYPDTPIVRIRRAAEPLLEVGIFDALSQIEIDPQEAEMIESMPTIGQLPDEEAVIYKYRVALSRSPFAGVWDYDPVESDDWSGLLWRLLNICFEAGMEPEEVFAVALKSKLNKYSRDGRPVSFLWKDVKKAEFAQKKFEVITAHRPLTMPVLIENEPDSKTIVDTYRTWACEATDALPEYHNLSAFILLSSLLAGNVKIETSYGTVRPNLWGLVLGDSTLTRKSTAMRMATDFMVNIDRDLLLATDGSMEGVLSGLQARSGRVSMFFRDEITGWFEGVKRKDYMADIPAMFTQLYDCPPFYVKRLRKELITISDPVFIFFGGGIKDKMFSLIDESMVLSGFIPRFLVVSGESDITSLRRTGPRPPQTEEARQGIQDKLESLYLLYNKDADVQFLGVNQTGPSLVDLTLTSSAWELYGDIEDMMVKAAHQSSMPGVALPTFERLSRSLLKMTALLAAARQEPVDGKSEATVEDVKHAASYVQRWGEHTIELLDGLGHTVAEREIQRILHYIKGNPGIVKSDIMRNFHLRRREMGEIEGTLEDRGQIHVQKQGRATRYTAL
jgi:hypothetical protein